MFIDNIPWTCRVGAGGVSSRDSLGQLQAYITGCLDDLSAAIQQRAIADINNWLVCLTSNLTRVCLFESTTLIQCMTLRVTGVKVQ